jgi:hypothetical protein
MSTDDSREDALSESEQERISDAVHAIIGQRALIEQAKGMLMSSVGSTPTPRSKSASAVSATQCQAATHRRAAVQGPGRGVPGKEARRPIRLR